MNNHDSKSVINHMSMSIGIVNRSEVSLLLHLLRCGTLCWPRAWGNIAVPLNHYILGSLYIILPCMMCPFEKRLADHTIKGSRCTPHWPGPCSNTLPSFETTLLSLGRIEWDWVRGRRRNRLIERKPLNPALVRTGLWPLAIVYLGQLY